MKCNKQAYSFTTYPEKLNDRPTISQLYVVCTKKTHIWDAFKWFLKICRKNATF